MFWSKLVELCNKKGISPNALCKELGLSSAIATYWKQGSVPRPNTIIKITDYLGVPHDYFDKDYDEIILLNPGNVFNIPVFESASAGFGAYASSSVLGYVPLNFPSKSEADRYICLKVVGDSMYPKIEDGDVIVVRKTDSVDSGSIAVVMVDNDEGFVKKIEYNHQGIVLHPINPLYPPMTFKGNDALRVSIVGKVTKIIKEV